MDSLSPQDYGKRLISENEIPQLWDLVLCTNYSIWASCYGVLQDVSYLLHSRKRPLEKSRAGWICCAAKYLFTYTYFPRTFSVFWYFFSSFRAPFLFLLRPTYLAGVIVNCDQLTLKNVFLLSKCARETLFFSLLSCIQPALLAPAPDLLAVNIKISARCAY